MVLAATVLALEARSRHLEQIVLDVVKLTRVAVEAAAKDRRPVARASRHQQNDVSHGRNAGSIGGVAAGRTQSGGFGVTLLGASAKRSRLLSGVFDDQWGAGFKLSLLVIGRSSGK